MHEGRSAVIWRQEFYSPKILYLRMICLTNIVESKHFVY